jgi:hypothetical protein
MVQHSSTEKKTDLFFFWFPKAGSSSLYEYCKQHPQIFTPSRPEVDFFIDDIREKMIQKLGEMPANRPINSMTAYEELYKDRSNEEYAVDFSPFYLYSKTAAQQIYDYNPSAIIIAIFREPMAFIESLHLQNLYGAFEDQHSLKEALNLEESRIQGFNDSKGSWFPDMLFYRMNANYVDRIKPYTDIFPKEQIQVYFFEELARDTPAFFNRILDQLGLKHADIDFKKYNSFKNFRHPGLIQFSKSAPVQGVKKGLKKIFPKQTIEQLDSVYKKVILKPNKNELDQELVDTVRGGMLNMVVEFEKHLKKYQLIEKDFDLVDYWKYRKYQSHEIN